MRNVINSFSIRKVSCFIEKKSSKISEGKWYFGGWKNTKNEEISLKTGNQYHVTGTIGSNLTYLATQRQVSMGVELFIGNPVMSQKFVPRFFFILAMSKCMVSMATHNVILLNGDVPTKATITRLIFSLDCQPWYQIKA